MRYEDLPDVLKYLYSRDEFMWLSDERKENLERDECLPEEEPNDE